MVLKSKRRKLRSGVEEEEERRKKEGIMKTSECWVALKAENIFTAARKFQFRLFFKAFSTFSVVCFVPVLSQTNAVYFIRRESTPIHKIGIKKNGALFLKRIFKERKHFLFNLLDLKMKFTQLLRHFFFFRRSLFNFSSEENFKNPFLSSSLACIN